MPAQVAHWPDVKATALHTGSLKAAAQAHGIKHAAVRQRSKREKWPVGQRAHVTAAAAVSHAKEQIVKASQGTVTHVTSAAEAALNTQADDSRRTRSAALKFAALTTEHAARLAESDPLLALNTAPLVKAGVQTAAIAGDWSAAQRDIRINVFSDGAKVIEAVEIEATAERIVEQTD